MSLSLFPSLLVKHSDWNGVTDDGSVHSVSAGSGEELTSLSLWGGECLCSTLGVCGSENTWFVWVLGW